MRRWTGRLWAASDERCRKCVRDARRAGRPRHAADTRCEERKVRRVGEGLAPPETRLRDNGRGKPLPYIFSLSAANGDRGRTSSAHWADSADTRDEGRKARRDAGICTERRRGRKKRGADGAAVEKRKDKRKPEAFFGYRKRVRQHRALRASRECGAFCPHQSPAATASPSGEAFGRGFCGAMWASRPTRSRECGAFGKRKPSP